MVLFNVPVNSISVISGRATASWRDPINHFSVRLLHSHYFLGLKAVLWEVNVLKVRLWCQWDLNSGPHDSDLFGQPTTQPLGIPQERDIFKPGVPFVGHMQTA